MDNQQRCEFEKLLELKNEDKQSHETRLLQIMERSLLETDLTWFKEEIESLKERQVKQITPNLQEEARLLCVCLALVKNAELSACALPLMLDLLKNPGNSTNNKLRISLI